MANEKKDSTSDTLVMIAVLVIGLMIFNYFFGQQIKSFYLLYKMKELTILNSIYPTEYSIDAIKYLEENKIKDISFGQARSVGDYVGKYFNIPFIVILAIWGYRVYSKNPSQKFKRQLSMQTLKESEQVLWPYIAPMVNVNLMKESFDKGPYALGMRPYDFAVKYHLLNDERNVDSLDRKKSEKLFVSQLGKPFSTFDRLKRHEKALFAIFAAYGCGDKDGAMDAVNAIAISASKVGIKKMPDFSSAEPLYKYIEDPRVAKVIASHSYVYTLLSQMQEYARGTGVFPPSYYIWLKPRDRTLWYTLNCVGRQVSFVEVAGIFGHWKAEQIAGHKIDTPYVTKAVDGLERALSEVKLA